MMISASIPAGEIGDVEGVGLMGQIAGGLVPGVLKDGDSVFDGLLDERKDSRIVRIDGDPELHSDHPQLLDAAAHLHQRFIGVDGIQVAEPQHQIGVSAHGLGYVIIRLGKHVGRRLIRPLPSERRAAKTLDPKPGRRLDQLGIETRSLQMHMAVDDHFTNLNLISVQKATMPSHQPIFLPSSEVRAV